MLIKIPRGSALLANTRTRARLHGGSLKKIFFQSLLSYRMRNRPTLTTVLRRVGEFNTSLIARLKLPKKSIITRSQQEKMQKKNRLESSTRPPSGRVIIMSNLRSQWIHCFTLRNLPFRLESKVLFTRDKLTRAPPGLKPARVVFTRHFSKGPFT